MVSISNLKAASNSLSVARRSIFLSLTIVLTLMCLFVSNPSGARFQTAPTEGENIARFQTALTESVYTLTEVDYQVDGERVTDANTLAMLREWTTIRVGEPFSRHHVYRSVVSLYASAQFSTVEVYATGIHPPVARLQTSPTEKKQDVQDVQDRRDAGNMKGVIVNDDDGSTDRDKASSSPLSERLANDKKTDRNVSLTFSLTSVMRIADIETLGVPAEFRGPLEKVMQQRGRLQVGSRYHPASAQRDISAIKTECAHWGYFGATVKATFSQQVGKIPRTGNLTYQLTLGAPSRISHIRIQENGVSDNVPDRDKAFLDRKGEVYRRTAVERDADALVALYRKRGYLAARVRHTFAPETGILQFTVDAGKRLDIMIVNNEKVVIDNVNDGSTEKHVIAPTTVIERLANDKKLRKSPFLWQQRVTAYFQEKGYDGTTVEVEETARNITFTIRLGTRYVVTRVTFSGNSAFSSAELLREMQTKPQGFLARRLRKRFFSQETLNSDADRLRILYQNAGYPVVKIETQLRRFSQHAAGEGEGGIEIHVIVVESAREVIYRCEFQGNRALSVKTLLDALQAVGFSPPQPNARFIRNDYRNAVLRAYQERGYMDARVEVRYVARTERPVFHLAGAAAEQGIAALNAGGLSEELGATMGMHTFTLTQMGNLWRLQDSGGIARYTLQQAQTETGELLLIGFEHHVLRVAISEGSPVYFGGFTFTGDAGVRNEVLTREVRHLVGTLWTPARLSEAVRRLYNTGIFRRISVSRKSKANEKVDIDMQVYPTSGVNLLNVDVALRKENTERKKTTTSFSDDAERTRHDVLPIRTPRERQKNASRTTEIRDVVVQVEKQKAGSYQAGLGYSTTDGFRTTLALQHRNLYRRNIGASLSGRAGVRAGTLGYLLAGRLTKPWLLGRNRGTLQVSERRMEADDNVRVRQSRLTLSRELSNALLVQCDYSYRFLRQAHGEIPRDGVSPERGGYTEDTTGQGTTSQGTTVSSLRLSWRYDSRLPFLNPTAGVLNEVTLEYAGGFLQGQTGFIKSTFDVRGYRELVKGGLTVATALRLGVTKGLGRNRDAELISFERFWAGGSTTVRGYGERSLGPLDSAGNHRGDVLFVFNTELRFRLYQPVGGVVFFDTGTVWRSLNTFAFVADELPAAVGIGLRLKWGAFTGGADYAVLVRDIPAATVTPFSLRLGSTF